MFRCLNPDLTNLSSFLVQPVHNPKPKHKPKPTPKHTWLGVRFDHETWAHGETWPLHIGQAQRCVFVTAG